VLTVAWALAEIREAMYDLEQSCTTDGPQTVVKRKSKLHCASACSGQLECREMNFDETTKDCSLYKHKALFFAALPGCVRYKVMFQMCPCNIRRENVSRKSLENLYKALTLTSIQPTSKWMHWATLRRHSDRQNRGADSRRRRDRVAEGVEGERRGEGIFPFPSDYGSGGAMSALLVRSGAKLRVKMDFMHIP